MRRVAGRLHVAVTWLEAIDPARELLARLRLSAAMRKARAALASHDTTCTAPRDLVGHDDAKLEEVNR